MARFGLFFMLIILFFGCSATQLEPAASKVRIYTDIPQTEQCKYIGEVIGSEGQLYNYWFISNYDLTEGARNDMRNQAYKMGGNVVQIETSSLNYATSTVYVGNVYHCL